MHFFYAQFVQHLVFISETFSIRVTAKLVNLFGLIVVLVYVQFDGCLRNWAHKK